MDASTASRCRVGPATQPDPIGLAGGLNAFGYADVDPVNRSDPFGLKATDSESDVVSIDRSESDDPCDAYKSDFRVRWICKWVTGDSASSQNRCTATCLANLWESWEADKGKPLDSWEIAVYIGGLHPPCYRSCSYSPAQFGLDVANGTGVKSRTARRQSFTPAPPQCAKSGVGCSSP